MKNLTNIENLDKVEKANKAFQVIANMQKDVRKVLLEGLTASFELAGAAPLKLNASLQANNEDCEMPSEWQ